MQMWKLLVVVGAGEKNKVAFVVVVVVVVAAAAAVDDDVEADHKTRIRSDGGDAWDVMEEEPRLALMMVAAVELHDGDVDLSSN